METTDVAIVGGGVIGSAVAYFLAAQPAFDGAISVVERDPTYSACSTTLSAGSIRYQYSAPVNIEISKFGVHFLANVADYLSVDGEAPALDFVQGGYLFLASPEGVAILEANHAVQRRHDAPVALLSPAELKERFPWLEVGDLGGGSLGTAGEGWFDPHALLHGFRRKARALGVTYLADEVTGIERSGNRVTALAMRSGARLACGTVVNAAGPRAATVAAMAGLELPVRPRKRIVYVFDCRAPVPDCPLIINPNGVYVRPESGHYICGVSPPAAEDPDTLDLEVDYRWFDDVVWPTLAARVPAFEAIKLVRAWAGHYAYNTFDRNALLGPHPEVANFLFANGFTGHGLQQSPAVGRGLAELIALGAYRSLDLSDLAYERWGAGRAVREVNVV